jgi:hypothetical protein
MAPFKPSAQVRHTVAAMEARLLENLSKLDRIENRFTDLDNKLDQQAERLDQVQMKVDLSMTKLGKLEEDQIAMGQLLQTKGASPSVRPPPASAPTSPTTGLLGPRPATAPAMQVTTFRPPALVIPESSRSREEPGEHHQRRPWMPRMDFPRFDGTHASIWVDTCGTFFTLYHIAPGF